MYTATQKRLIALEVARAGLNLAAACKRLREEYETFDGIGESTLRRLLRDQEFQAAVAEQAASLRAAENEAIRVSERDRALNELQGSMVERLSRDERLLDDARTRLEEVLRDRSLVNPKLAVWAFDALAKIIDRRRSALIPAVAETQQATCLVKAVMETAVEQLGQGKSKAFIARVRELYEAKVKEADHAADAAKLSADAT
ncbi:MAG: hypothetical protein HS116_02225 [Planctomycetes bacterium]|nr:hypothetical protein [Planctomycetota bacterium]